MSKNIDLLPKGFRDRLFDEAAAISSNARVMTDILTHHGYQRIMPAIAEYESNFVGRNQGLERNHLLRFTDPVAGRTLAIRSDITMQIGRIATTRLADLPRPLRLSYHGTIAKLHADPLNPDREMSQLGAELIGSDSVQAASEIVTLAIKALQSVGIRGVTIDFTLPDLVEQLSRETFPLDDDILSQVREQLDMKDASSIKALGADNYLPLLSATGEFDQALAKLRAIDAGGTLSSRIKGLVDIVENIADDIHITLDPTERHGFEYQSWIGFTLYADNIAGAIGRGGSYALDNGEVATGFSLYPDMLNKLVSPTNSNSIFLPIGHDNIKAEKLRDEGWITIAALTDDDDGKILGCSHILQDTDILAL